RGVAGVVELDEPVPSSGHRPAPLVHQPIACAEAHELGPVAMAQWRKSPPPAAVQENMFRVPCYVAIAGWWSGTQARVDARVEVYPRAEDDGDAKARGIVTPAAAHVHWRASGGAVLYSRS